MIVIVCLFFGVRSCATNESSQSSKNNTARTTASSQSSGTAGRDVSGEIDYSEKMKTISTWYEFCQGVTGPYIRAIFVLENTSNVNLYLSDERIDVSDESGHLIATETPSAYPYIVAPGEQTVIYELILSDNLTEDVQYNVQLNLDVEKFRGEYQRLSVSDLSISETSYGAIKILGRAKNTTGEQQGFYYSVATLYDADGNVLACFSSMQDDLEIGEEKSFEMMESFSHITLADVASYTVIAYPFQIQF